MVSMDFFGLQEDASETILAGTRVTFYRTQARESLYLKPLIGRVPDTD